MNVLIVYAHPEPRSLTGSLRNVAVDQLIAEGHQVKISDLYVDGWKPSVDRTDFPSLEADARLRVPFASGEAFNTNTLTSDVAGEMEKLLWADLLILQFPFWWFSMPAIMKGWVDRVFVSGFANGIGEYSETRFGDRFGEGRLAGKRAMLIVTAGGWPEHYGPRAINGPIDDLLFPINHGILFYPGYDVLPPFVTYAADRLTEAAFEDVTADLRARMKSVFAVKPISYRRQNHGDYVIPTLELRSDIEPAEGSGFGIHITP